MFYEPRLDAHSWDILLDTCFIYSIHHAADRPRWIPTPLRPVQAPTPLGCRCHLLLGVKSGRKSRRNTHSWIDSWNNVKGSRNKEESCLPLGRPFFGHHFEKDESKEVNSSQNLESDQLGWNLWGLGKWGCFGEAIPKSNGNPEGIQIYSMKLLRHPVWFVISLSRCPA